MLHSLLARFGNQMAESHFKRIPQGWIFRAAPPWSITLGSHYLVSDPTKAKIEVLLGASYLVAWLTIAALGFLIFLLLLQSSQTTWIECGFLLLAVY